MTGLISGNDKQSLNDLIREMVRVELAKRLKIIKGSGGNTVIASDADIRLTTMGTHKAYYNGVEILTGAGGGDITGSGTINYIPKFTGASVIGNSNLIDDGTDLSSAINIILKSAKQLKLHNVSNTLVGKVFGTSYTIEATTYNGLQLQPQNTIGTTPGNIYIGDYNAAPAGRGIKITDSGIDIYPTGIEKTFLHHTELANFRLENLATGSLPDGGKGGLAYDTTVNEAKVNKGIVGSPNWVTLGGGVWGSITGTLSNQTDLQNALDAKLPLAGGTLTGNLTINKSLPSIIFQNSGVTKGYLEATAINFDLYPSGTAIMRLGTTGLQTILYGTPITVGANLAMSGNKITGLAAGTVAGDALRYEQLTGTSITVTVAASNSYNKNADYVCDGTNDQVEIQAAIDVVYTNGGGIVFLRGGTYNISATINIKENVLLHGEGQKTYLEMISGFVGDACITASIVNYCQIERIRINGNKSVFGTTQKSGIIFWKTKYCKITNCNVYNCSGIGVQISTSEYAEIRNNYITGSGNAQVGLWLGNIDAGYTAGGHIINGNNLADNGLDGIICNATTCTISNNVVKGNGISATYTASGIYCNGTSGASRITIVGNLCVDNDGNGIDIDNVKEVLISGNICSNNNSSGILAVNDCRGTITGNTCRNNGNIPATNQDDGITLLGSTTACTNMVVIGNTCYDDRVTKTQVYGIHELNQGAAPAAPDYNVIVGNTVAGNLTGGISYVSWNTIVSHNIGNTEITVTPDIRNPQGIIQYFRTSNGSTSFFVSDNIAEAITFNRDLLPNADNSFDLGSPTYRWSLIRGVTITSGDFGWEEKVCSKCMLPFKVGDVLSMIVKNINENGALTIPIHSKCAHL